MLLNNEVASLMIQLDAMRRHPEQYETHIANIAKLRERLPYLQRYMLWYKNVHGGMHPVPPMPPGPKRSA